MGILTSSRTKSIRTYQELVLREELEKINAACDRFLARRGVAPRKSKSPSQIENQLNLIASRRTTRKRLKTTLFGSAFSRPETRE